MSIANILNAHFGNVGPNLQKEIVSEKSLQILHNENASALKFREIDVSEVSYLIRRLSPSKSCVDVSHR